jgi:hypothetical protein
MAADGKEFLYLGPLAGGAGDLLIAEDQGLKVFITFLAVIFKDGHALSPYLFSFFIITPPRHFFQSFAHFLTPNFRDIVSEQGDAHTREIREQAACKAHRTADQKISKKDICLLLQKQAETPVEGDARPVQDHRVRNDAAANAGEEGRREI